MPTIEALFKTLPIAIEQRNQMTKEKQFSADERNATDDCHSIMGAEFPLQPVAISSQTPRSDTTTSHDKHYNDAWNEAELNNREDAVQADPYTADCQRYQDRSLPRGQRSDNSMQSSDGSGTKNRDNLDSNAGHVPCSCRRTFVGNERPSSISSAELSPDADCATSTLADAVPQGKIISGLHKNGCGDCEEKQARSTFLQIKDSNIADRAQERSPFPPSEISGIFSRGKTDRPSTSSLILFSEESQSHTELNSLTFPGVPSG